MSVKIMSLVWERAPYTAGSLIVLLALADWANDDGVAWPSMERLAEKARIDRRSAQRIVRQLEKDGVLQVEHGGGRSKQHKYVIKVETATFRRPLCATEKGDISCLETATFDPERATFDAETATPVSPDPLVEPLEDPPEEPSRSRPRRRNPSTETPVPDHLVVTPEMRQWAETKTPGVDVDYETEKFLDKARAKGWTAVDWIATWRNWMRNAKRFADEAARKSGAPVRAPTLRERMAL